MQLVKPWLPLHRSHSNTWLCSSLLNVSCSGKNPVSLKKCHWPCVWVYNQPAPHTILDGWILYFLCKHTGDIVACPGFLQTGRPGIYPLQKTRTRIRQNHREQGSTNKEKGMMLILYAENQTGFVRETVMCNLHDNNLADISVISILFMYGLSFVNSLGLLINFTFSNESCTCFTCHWHQSSEWQY